MNLRSKLILQIILLAGMLFLHACSDSPEDNQPDFDRTAFLESMADNLIIPAYEDLSVKTGDLTNKVNLFTEDPSPTALEAARVAWKNACLSWERANAFNFGPAGAEGLRKTLVEEIGTFPVSASKIENAISSGNYSLSDANRDARGLLTVEYLLFEDSPESVVNSYASENRKTYLKDVVENIDNRVEEVLSAWQSSYREEFVNNDGTDAGSSVSMLYNEFVRSYESIKNFKLGLPLGKQPGQTSTEPSLVEAYYSGESVAFIREHFDAIVGIWYGKITGKEGETGIGFDDYLQSVTGGEALIESTQQQISVIEAAMVNVPEDQPLSEQVGTNFANVELLQTELQKNTRYFKSDMSSLLGIAITFSSGDGD